jgi:hypothetical protein
MINPYNDIDIRIRNALEAGRRRFTICPMGVNGMLTKQILNCRYGITEERVIDNGLADINTSVSYSTGLDPRDCAGLTVILNTTDRIANGALLDDLLKVMSRDRIVNILEPSVMEVPEKSRYFHDLRALLRVMDIVGHTEYVRVGRDNDGGYIMPDYFGSCRIAYSFGISDDVSWDCDIARRGIDVYQYDHTIDALPKWNTRFRFFKFGIAGKDDTDRSLLSIETILKRNGHDTAQNLLLKMDVEGAEWDFLNCAAAETLSLFSQIVFEFHSLTDVRKENKIISALKKLNRTHQVVCVHGNNYGYAQEAEGILMPASLEATYVRRADHSFRDAVRRFPTEIDMPCCAERADFALGDWG